MTFQLSIIGLGQIGSSIGLALQARKDLLVRVGHDKNLDVARRAEKVGAVDRVDFNLPSSVRQADLVILALPLDQLRETLEIIAPDLPEGCVVMDTSPLKQVVISWAQELLPPGRHYVGLTPVINAAYLDENLHGIEAAHADLFQNGLLGIVAPPQADPAALKMAADLAQLLGAAPLFADPLELDGLMAATHLLPHLISAALLNATLDQPGWREGRKLASQPYAAGTAPMGRLEDIKELVAMAMLDTQNALRVVDNALHALSTLRQAIAQGDAQTLRARLDQAHAGRQTWWGGRRSGEFLREGRPAVDIPEAPGPFARWFGFGRKGKPQPTS